MRSPLIRGSIPIAAIALGSILAACGGGGDGGGNTSPTQPQIQTLSVAFEYRARTEIDPAVDFETCTSKMVHFTAHLHFIWNDWEDRRYLRTDGKNRFWYNGEVPVGKEVQTALHDPNNCLKGDVYVAPKSLYANGVLLRRVVPVQEGTGLTFRQQADGTISP